MKPGAIIIRQRGTHVQPGMNVGLGRDYTIYSLVEGMVDFKWFSKRHQNVYLLKYCNSLFQLFQHILFLQSQ